MLSDIIVCSIPSSTITKGKQTKHMAQIIRILPATNGVYNEN